VGGGVSTTWRGEVVEMGRGGVEEGWEEEMCASGSYRDEGGKKE